jgi:hypothetical protein
LFHPEEDSLHGTPAIPDITILRTLIGFTTTTLGWSTAIVLEQQKTILSIDLILHFLGSQIE